MMREGNVSRKTKETDIKVRINIDETGESQINTGIGFFDHMLEGFAKHGKTKLQVNCVGDLHVDMHHTVEDIGIALGQAYKEAIGDKRGIRRFGECLTPMDEALVQTALDLSGRPFFVYNVDFYTFKIDTQNHGYKPSVGNFECELAEEFFRAFAVNAEITLHQNLSYGKNAHHIIEALFKGLGRAMHSATRIIDDELPTTKGVL